MVSRSLKTADAFLKDGVSAGVVDLHTIKPIDKDNILSIARETGTMVTAEEHNIVGGLGSAVSEVITKNFPVPLKRVGIKDRFSETGPSDVLFDIYEMSVDDIILAVNTMLKLKHKLKR